MKKYFFLQAIVLICLVLPAQKKIFEPDKKSEWYTYTSQSGKNNDTAKVFQFEKDVLHVSGAETGYMATVKKYSNFHFTVEFKWGEKKYPPRENVARDNGICYYAVPTDRVWPRSVECQIQEGDCGDFWLIDSVTAIVDGVLQGPTANTRVIKKKDNEKPTGEWNRIEIIASRGKCTHIVNGMIVNEGENMSLRSGRILIQSEGAEIYYRKIDLKEL